MAAPAASVGGFLSRAVTGASAKDTDGARSFWRTEQVPWLCRGALERGVSETARDLRTTSPCCSVSVYTEPSWEP